MILAAKGKDKKSRKQLKQSFQKKYFFRLLFSIFQQTWGPKMSNNSCPLFTMLTKPNLSSASRSKCCKDKLYVHAKTQLLFLNNGIPIRFLEKLQNLKWSDIG
jgi:hypothetical protein